jgi:hypothetical protein
MGSVAVNNSARLHDNHSIHKSTLVQDNLLVLTASGNGFRDEAQIWFNESSTLAFDPDHDVYKLWGDSMAPQLYSELPDSTLASLNVLPWTGSNMMVRMGYRNEVEGTFTIAARNMQSFSGSVPIWIEDLQESRLQDLREDSVYSFNSAPSDNSDRFRIYFRDPATGIHGESLPGIEIYSYDKVVYVRRNGGSQLQGNLLLYDMTGRKVFSGKLKDTGLNLFYPDVIQACYIAKVITETNTFTQKVFLK